MPEPGFGRLLNIQRLILGVSHLGGSLLEISRTQKPPPKHPPGRGPADGFRRHRQSEHHSTGAGMPSRLRQCGSGADVWPAPLYQMAFLHCIPKDSHCLGGMDV